MSEPATLISDWNNTMDKVTLLLDTSYLRLFSLFNSNSDGGEVLGEDWWWWWRSWEELKAIEEPAFCHGYNFFWFVMGDVMYGQRVRWPFHGRLASGWWGCRFMSLARKFCSCCSPRRRASVSSYTLMYKGIHTAKVRTCRYPLVRSAHKIGVYQFLHKYPTPAFTWVCYVAVYYKATNGVSPNFHSNIGVTSNQHHTPSYTLCKWARPPFYFFQRSYPPSPSFFNSSSLHFGLTLRFTTFETLSVLARESWTCTTIAATRT